MTGRYAYFIRETGLRNTEGVGRQRIGLWPTGLPVLIAWSAGPPLSAGRTAGRCQSPGLASAAAVTGAAGFGGSHAHHVATGFAAASAASAPASVAASLAVSPAPSWASPTASPTPVASVSTGRQVVCHVALDLLVDMPFVSVAPLDYYMAMDTQHEIRSFRSAVSGAISATEYLFADPGPADSLRVALFPQGLRRMKMSLGIYGRELDRVFANGSISTVERLDLQDQGEKIEATLMDAMDWACDG